MELAERFKMPILTFIDTPGAYPGIGAEERVRAKRLLGTCVNGALKKRLLLLQ